MSDAEALRIVHRLVLDKWAEQSHSQDVVEWIECQLQEMREPLYPIADATPILSWPLIDSPLPISALGVSDRVYAALWKANLRTVGQVAMLTVPEIMEIRWFGPVALAEVRAGLHNLTPVAT